MSSISASPVHYCRWDFCSSTFRSRTELSAHLQQLHVAHERPEEVLCKRRRISPGVYVVLEGDRLADNLSMRYSQTTGDITTTTDHTSLSHPYPPSFPSQPSALPAELLEDVNTDMYLDIPSPPVQGESGEIGESGESGGSGPNLNGIHETDDPQLQPSCGQPMRTRIIHVENQSIEETQSFPATQEIASQGFIREAPTPSPFVPPTQAFRSPQSHAVPLHTHSSPSQDEAGLFVQTSVTKSLEIETVSTSTSISAQKTESSVSTTGSVSMPKSDNSVAKISQETKGTTNNTTNAEHNAQSTPARPRTSSVALPSPALAFGVALHTPVKDQVPGKRVSGENKGIEGVGFGWGLGK